MRGWVHRTVAAMAAIALAIPSAQPALAQNSSQDSSTPVSATQVSSTPQAGFTLQMNGELVLTNVVARDTKTGEVVRGLKPSDFHVYENGREQQIATFDFQSVDMATPLNEATVTGL